MSKNKYGFKIGDINHIGVCAGFVLHGSDISIFTRLGEWKSKLQNHISLHKDCLETIKSMVVLNLQYSYAIFVWKF